MKRNCILSIAALGLGLVPMTAPAVDWDTIEATEIDVFYAGISPMEWILGDLRVDRVRHGGGRAFRQGDTCADCHSEETRVMGELIVSGEKLEPNPVAGRPGAIPVRIQAAHDGETLHMRFSWSQPAAYGAESMDPDNPVKLAFMLDAGKVDLADLSGCWASCHGDSRTMPDGATDKTKYVKGGSLADGIYYDLLQWRSGDNQAWGGYVADRRVLEKSAHANASGVLEGDTWTVTFSRPLQGGEGDISLEPGQVYNFGFAIHDQHSAGRYHHVSLGYRLGIDAAADISAQKF